MEDRIDLDDAAQEIEARRERWRGAGITVGETTWRDEADGWPWALNTSRASVTKPDSVGVALSKGKQQGSVVLFRGGWADLLYWNGEEGDVVDEAPGWDDWLTISRYGDLLDRFGRFFASE